MRNTLAGIAICIISAQALHAQPAMRYRDFELGSTLAAITALTVAAPSQVKIVHQRPAVIKELEWRPRRFSGGGALGTDPVAVVMFSFYNDQLFNIVVDYDRHRTAGMTETDLIDAITNTYGPASTPLPGVTPTVPARYSVPDTPVAVWGDSEYVVTLLRVAYPETYRLVLAHARLEQLARVASVAAVRLDAEEAPQREIERRKRLADEAEVAREKARGENKPLFRP
jgi:hypothetical protein